MADISELKEERIKKLNNLKLNGIDPYPAKIELEGEKISSERAREMPEGQVVLAGRVMTIRGQGKILFIDLADQEGKFQVVLKVDILGEEKLKVFFENVDGGDFVAFSGKLFITQRGEKSLEAIDWQILSKALLPIPSTFYGLENEEEQLRKRYLDFALNKEKRDLFFKKALFWQTIRSFLISKNFLEVETPYIEVTTGGAEARPFATHHNDFDIDVYLRISVGELWQKRLLAGGFERTFEIGRVFRNEGSSPEHLQEYTNCEFYAAYMDEKEGIELVREMYLEIAKKVFGKTEFTVRGHTFDLSNEWKKLDYRDTVLEMTGVDINIASNDDIKERLQELNVKWEGDNKERLVDTLWKYCRKKISGPAYLTNFPKLMSPLAKLNTDGETAKMFVILLGGSEVGKAYAELNDPEVQKNNFETQQRLIESGDEEAMMSDLDFVEMLEHGMPPAFGFGAGERLFAFLAELPIRDTQLFPLVKPKRELTDIKKKETKIAVAVINKNANLERWQELNTVAHLSAEFAGKAKENLFYQDKIVTKDGSDINLNIQHAIILKEINSNKELQDFIVETKKKGLEVYTFTREMLNTTNDKKVIEETKNKDFKDVEFLGVLIFGEKSKIDALTNKFELFK